MVTSMSLTNQIMEQSLPNGTPLDVEAEIDKLFDKDTEELEIMDDQEINYLLGEGGLGNDSFSGAEDVLPSQFTEFAIKLPIAGKIENFSFEERGYLRQIYDTGAHRVLLKAGRQVEKTVREVEKVCTASGLYKTFGELQVGDELLSLSAKDSEEERYAVVEGETRRMRTSWGIVPRKVVATKKVPALPCYEIQTRMGDVLTISSKTPLLVSGSWKVASEVRVGDRIAVARGFSDAAKFGRGWVGRVKAQLLGILIADGSLLNGDVRVTKYDDAERRNITDLLDMVGNPYSVFDSCKPYVRIKVGIIIDLLDECGLMGRLSAHKFVPQEIFTKASLDETLAFLLGLWRCDGSIKQTTPTKWDIVYASTSKQLATQVRALLSKIGVPSRIRANDHKAYNDDLDKDQYLVRVETIEGVRRFLKLVMGQDVDVPKYGDSNRDTYPKEVVQPLVRSLCDKFGLSNATGPGNIGPLREHGLRRTLKLPPTRAKLKAYLDMFKKLGLTEELEYQQLESILLGDVIWDTVTKVTDVGKQDCVHIEVEHDHNFLHGNVIEHNSTLLGNICLSYTSMVMAFRVLYVTATAQQATVFSVDRIKEPMELSPVIASLTNTKLAQNVFFKQFLNRSQIRIRYAFLSADRVRGIPADKILIDEIQDIMAQNIPVIEQCASHSPWKIYRYSGTPKSMDNTIQIYWDQYSTQNEWAVPCDRHSPRHWNILGEKNIGRKGLICAKCGKKIDPKHPDCTWVAMQPKTVNNEQRVTFEGFRIPQLMVPWIVEDEEAWNDQIIFAHKRYDRPKFHNEVLGLSYDSGSRPLTRAQVQACCQEHVLMKDVIENSRKCNGGVYAGIDWGLGENESYTVLSLGGYMGKEFQIFFSRRFTGQDIEPQMQLEKIAKMLVSIANFRIAGTDYGIGFDRNDWLARNFGPHKIRKIQYVGRLKQKVKWEPQLGRFVVNRTEIMSDIFNAIKRKQVLFPKFEEYFEPHCEDMLNIFSEYNEMMRMIQYKLSPGKSDDTFHSIVYCFIAAYLERPRPDILIPTKANDVIMPS